MNKKTVKYRLDYSAHYSIVVEVPEDDFSEDKAIEIGDLCMEGANVIPTWELDDGGIEIEEDDDCEPINNVDIDFIN